MIIATFMLAALVAQAMPTPTPTPTPPEPGTTTTQQTTTTTTTTTDTDVNADLDDKAAFGPNDQYGDPICGVWANGVWHDNGHCPKYTVGPHRVRLEGTIIAVKGHLVTVQQATRTIVIDDTPALNRQMSGKVAVGRHIVAYGYVRGDNYYATIIE